jgi:hypothetical protein
VHQATGGRLGAIRNPIDLAALALTAKTGGS